MRLAAQIQSSMLPGIPVNIPGWKVDYHFQPMSGISGDLIDIYTFGDEFFDGQFGSARKFFGGFTGDRVNRFT